MKFSKSFEPGILKRECKESRVNHELCSTLRCRMGDNQTSVLAFAQNTRDEVRVVGDGAVCGALAARPGMKQTNYIMTTTLGILCLTPSQPQTHRIYNPSGVFPTVNANLGKAGQDQSSILERSELGKTENRSSNTMKAEVRRLTPTEVQRLQGFDEGHLDVNNQGDSAKYSETGNSWAVPNARFVLKGVHKADEKLTGKKRSFKYGTISSGVEAHTQAVAGFGDKAVFFSEIAPAPCGVLAAHYPNVPNLGDMTLIDFDAEKKCIHNRPYDGYSEPDEKAMGFKPYKTENPVEIPAEFGELDLVSGGTPCQSVSCAGKRHGMAEGSGTRSSLAFQLPRIGAAVGADFIIWENVSGAFSSNGGKDFTWLLHRMTEYGYKALAWRCMDAQFIRTDKHPRGVPQRRRRVWIVGYKGSDWRVPCEALFEPMKVLGNEPPKRTVGIGYLKKVVANGNAEPQKSELEEFLDFIKGADPRIVEVLERKGVCETVEARLKELRDAEANKSSSTSDRDLFGGCDDNLDYHQGRGLKAADLDLHFPDNADIRRIPQVEIYQWAKTVCKEIGYLGEMFKPHEGISSVEDLSQDMLDNLGNAGFLCDGLVCTMKMPEWNAGVTEEELATMPTELAELYDGDVCGLSDVLEDDPDPKFKLSWRACYGILRRAVNRGKKIPIELGYALVERIIKQTPFVKWVATHGKDTVKKEGDISERQIAKTAFDDYVSCVVGWDHVEEREQVKSADDLAQEDAEDDDECGDYGNDGEPEEQ